MPQADTTLKELNKLAIIRERRVVEYKLKLKNAEIELLSAEIDILLHKQKELIERARRNIASPKPPK